MSLYLDTSVIVPLHVEESASARLHEWLESVDEPIVVADLAVVEFSSAISRLIRMGQMTPAVAAETIGDFERWRRASAMRVENLPVDIRVAAEFVREPYPPLLSADAIHLATCQRLNATIVSHDSDILKIAGRMGVAFLAP